MDKSEWFIAIVALNLFALSEQQQVHLNVLPKVSQNFNERVSFQLEQQVASYVKQEVTYKAYASYYDRADVALQGFRDFFTSLEKKAIENAFSLTKWINLRGGHLSYPIIQLKDGCRDIRTELASTNITRDSRIHMRALKARKNPLICDFLVLQDETSIHEKKTKYLKEKKKPLDIDMGKWQKGLYGLEDALAMERVINQEILSVLHSTRIVVDPVTRHKLDEYLADQTASIYRVSQLLERLQKHQSLDTYELDEYLLDEELQEKPTEQ